MEVLVTFPYHLLRPPNTKNAQRLTVVVFFVDALVFF